MSNKERRLNLTIHTYTFLIFVLKRKARVANVTLLGGGA